jgi:hypothetical protein
MVFKKDLTPLSKRGPITKHVGKGSTEAQLPQRGALNNLTKGSPLARSMNNYAKATPGPEDQTPGIMDMDQDGI